MTQKLQDKPIFADGPFYTVKRSWIAILIFVIGVVVASFFV